MLLPPVMDSDIDAVLQDCRRGARDVASRLGVSVLDTSLILAPTVERWVAGTYLTVQSNQATAVAIKNEMIRYAP